MRRRLPLAFLILLFGSAAQAVEIGEPAPDLEATLFDGTPFSLKAHSGDVVVVHFWASWCEPCRSEMPVLDRYFQQHRSEGLQILAISMDRDRDEAKAKEQMKALHFPSAMSVRAKFKGYGRIWRLPLTFVIDRRGILRKDGWVQKHLLNSQDLEATLDPLLKAPR